MNTDIAQQKQELRRIVRARVKAISKEERQTLSRHACDWMRQSTLWREAKTVLLYAPMTDEIDVWPLVREGIALGKIVALPKFMPQTADYAAFQIRDIATDCSPAKFGIMEPNANCPCVGLNRLDLTLAPGIAFDTVGRRLGRGRGFYDKILAQAGGTKCGVAFDQQFAETVPIEPHDTPLDCILTPSGWVGLRVNT
jgi:5-formyltetrahydrofolate cyclo-ligase